MPPGSAPTRAYGVCDDNLTGLTGLGVVARLAQFLGLPEMLAAAVCLERRRRGCSDMQILLGLCRRGHLHAVDALGTDDVARRACGLQAGPHSRRLVAQECVQRWGYVSVFVDGKGIEVEGQLFEIAERGCNGEKQYGLHAVFVGAAWVSARLQAGGTDVQGDGREQLDRMRCSC